MLDLSKQRGRILCATYRRLYGGVDTAKGSDILLDPTVGSGVQTTGEQAMSVLERVMKDDEEGKKLVKEFFRLIHTVESTDSGRDFFPVQWNCCRVMLTPKVEEAMEEMRKWAGASERPRLDND